jgi:kojibiose phosphorylase
VNLWRISEEKFDPTAKKLHSQETVYTVGNGYFCTRGTFEEGYLRAHPATLLYGVFDSVPVAKEELANAPDWTPIGLLINGERFRLDRGTILGYQRSLDMHDGILSRTTHWQSPQGGRVHISSERIASLADEHVAAIRYSVTADEQNSQPLDIVLWSSFNTAVGNYDLMHWDTGDQGREGEVLWLYTQTKTTLVQLAQTMSFGTQSQGFREEFVPSYAAPCIMLHGTLEPGATVTADKVVVMYTSRDGVEPVQAARTHHRQLIAATPVIFDTLQAKNQEAWHQFWQDADVIIEGDASAQLGMRYNIYQLRINASSHDDRYSIAAKGMTGFGYRGHIFHDTEIFMLPFFVYTLPTIARNLVMYRYHLLPEARKKAASNGYEGAQYPWESTLSGEETTPPAIIHPETGELIDVLNGSLELHISASVAYATWQYWTVSGDDQFMRDYGAETVLSTAMFWASRAQKNTQRNDYEITNVIGPDEWHEHVNNNAFTNYMARWNIRVALDIWHWLQRTAPHKAAQLEQQLDLTVQRLDHWQDVAKHMRILQDRQTGLFEQFDGFFELEPLDEQKYAGRTASYQGILGMKGVQKHRFIKQADVLMLLTVLNQEFDLGTKRANWDYYYPITDHDYGSSLTPAFHVILACELGKVKEAYELLMKGALIDLENLRANTQEGIHVACSGALWQATILGFAGLRLTSEGYTTNPHWPDGWTRLAFTFKHKGEPMRVDLRR